MLRGATLRIEPGSIVGLVGRNGAGKSTLLDCLMGIQRPDRGECYLFHTPSLLISDPHKAQIGYVQQGQAGFEWMRVREFLDLMASIYPAWDHALVKRLLDAWSLDGKQRLLTLSPGQRQQVALIRAIAHRPQLLVLDEPAASLDPVARRHVLGEIVDLALSNGSTVVFSTHIVSDLERIASHVAVLAHGRIALHDSLDAIKEQWFRLVVPAAQLAPPALPGEVTRCVRSDGSAVLVIRRTPMNAAAWPAQFALQPLALEDLLLELTQAREDDHEN